MGGLKKSTYVNRLKIYSRNKIRIKIIRQSNDDDGESHKKRTFGKSRKSNNNHKCALRESNP